MKYKITINDRTYEVEVERGVAQVTDEYDYVAPAAPVAAVPAAAPVAAAPTAAPAAPAPAAAAAKGEQVASPMPGTILNVLVKAGDTVKEGQNLMVLEAMKMENEILAPVGGVIAQLNVSKGATVNTGDLLAVIG